MAKKFPEDNPFEEEGPDDGEDRGIADEVERFLNIGKDDKKKGRQPKKQPEDDPVTQAEINRYRSFTWLRKKLGSKTGDGSDISDEEIADYIRLKRKEQRENVAKREQKTRIRESRILPRELHQKLKVSPNRVKRRLQEYLKDFDAPTANDMGSLRMLVVNELTIDLVDELMANLRGNTDPDVVKAFQSLASEKRYLLQENRYFQKMLGIDRESREKRKRDRNAADLIQETMVGAKEFVETQIVEVICPDCKTLCGWQYFLYRELRWSVEQTCGNCGAVLTVETDKEAPVVTGRRVIEERREP